MERNIIGGLAIATLLGLAIAIFIPGGKSPDKTPMLPWQIAIDANGQSNIFGLTIDKSTLSEAENLYQEKSTVSLFATPDNQYAVEAFFERLYLSGIRANLVMNIDIDPDTAAQMMERGIRMSRLGSGSSKVTLSEEDLNRVKTNTISLITYLPATDLDEELIQKRFGEPAERISEESGSVHWLYPDKGLDIALNPETKEVFQYIPPARFEQIRAPLLQKTAAAEK
jgi:hypothetical protein